jgi:hypothetical protein
MPRQAIGSILTVGLLISFAIGCSNGPSDPKMPQPSSGAPVAIVGPNAWGAPVTLHDRTTLTITQPVRSSPGVAYHVTVDNGTDALVT